MEHTIRTAIQLNLSLVFLYHFENYHCTECQEPHFYLESGTGHRLPTKKWNYTPLYLPLEDWENF